MELLKTVSLMVILMLLFISVGGYIGGLNGMIIAFLIALGLNFFSYFYSDKLILKHYNAQLVEPSNTLYKIVSELCKKANIPIPKIYIISDNTPNAFATGRNPHNSAVALTNGLLNLLDENEIKAVIAHELGHIRHYDILTESIVAIFAGAIAILANFAHFGVGLNKNENKANIVIVIILAIIMPLAATIIQMSISRSREFEADRFSANLTDPIYLVNALSKLEGYASKSVLKNADEQTAHMFIINPFSSVKSGISNLFRTHPSTKQRIDRLLNLKERSQSAAYKYFNS